MDMDTDRTAAATRVTGKRRRKHIEETPTLAATAWLRALASDLRVSTDAVHTNAVVAHEVVNTTAAAAADAATAANAADAAAAATAADAATAAADAAVSASGQTAIEAAAAAVSASGQTAIEAAAAALHADIERAAAVKVAQLEATAVDVDDALATLEAGEAGPQWVTRGCHAVFVEPSALHVFATTAASAPLALALCAPRGLEPTDVVVCCSSTADVTVKLTPTAAAACRNATEARAALDAALAHVRVEAWTYDDEKRRSQRLGAPTSQRLAAVLQLDPDGRTGETETPQLHVVRWLCGAEGADVWAGNVRVQHVQLRGVPLTLQPTAWAGAPRPAVAGAGNAAETAAWPVVLRSPEALLLEAMQRWDYALSANVLTTPALILAAMKRRDVPLDVVPVSMRTREVCLAAVRQNTDQIALVPPAMQTEDFFHDVVLETRNLEDVPAPFLTPATCLAAVQQCGWQLEFVPHALRTPAMCLAAVKQDWRALRHVPDDLRTEALCLLAVTQYGQALAYVPRELYSENMLKTALLRHGSLSNVPTAMRTGALCMLSVKRVPGNLQHVPLRLRTQRVCEAAVKRGGYALRWVPRAYVTHALCRTAVTSPLWLSVDLSPVPQNMRTFELCLAAVQRNGHRYFIIPEHHRTLAMRQAAVEQRGDVILRLPEHERTLELWRAAVHNAPSLRMHVNAPPELRNRRQPPAPRRRARV